MAVVAGAAAAAGSSCSATSRRCCQSSSSSASLSQERAVLRRRSAGPTVITAGLLLVVASYLTLATAAASSVTSSSSTMQRVLLLSAHRSSARGAAVGFVTPRLPGSSSNSQRRSMASARFQLSMKLKAGIVGLPNVGKSTLFNALTGGATAQAANFPFCTIEPNVGIVEVPDSRLLKLADIAKSESTVPAVLEFVDIAGLVKGASQGEGLGNKFLQNIRECDAIVQVVRCFEDDDIIHVSGSVDPVRDMEIINLELILADMAQVEKRMQRIQRDKTVTQAEKDGLDKVYKLLSDGRPAREADLTTDESAEMSKLGLLSGLKVIYAANVPDSELATGNPMVDKVRELAAKEGAKMVVVSAQVEAELVELAKEDRTEFLESLGVKEEDCGLRALVRATYELLGLQTYFTCGPKETRAWTIRKGATAPQAAGVIHSDFERGFIRAETMAYDDLVSLGSEKAVKDAGKMRSEGKEYVVKEADVMLFRFNV